MNLRFPDASIVPVLMLAAITAVWLGLWGPIDLARLKEWQTLMAGGLAVSAAGLAYQGAMAKVKLDREEAERKRNAEQLGLYLRLRTSLERVHQDASACIALIDAYQPDIGESFEVSADEIAVLNPPVLNEAWDKIYLIPPALLSSVEGLHRLLPAIEAELIKFHDQKWQVVFLVINGQDFGRQREPYLTIHSRRCHEILNHCEAVIKGLSSAIPPLRRFPVRD
ncbi:hypothetical protein [Bradyrhizobium sp. 23AC]